MSDPSVWLAPTVEGRLRVEFEALRNRLRGIASQVAGEELRPVRAMVVEAVVALNDLEEMVMPALPRSADQPSLVRATAPVTGAYWVQS